MKKGLRETLKTQPGFVKVPLSQYNSRVVFIMVVALCCILAGCTKKTNTAPHELADYLDQITTDGLFSGVVLISQGDDVFFEAAYGMADKSQNRLNNIDTPFNLGSAVKMFTSVAIAQLAEQGKLSFDDTIAPYVDGFPREIADAITIEQLLTHRSGLGDIFIPDYMEHKDEIDTVEGFMSYIINQPLLFEPGTRHEYSNGGFIVLGYIIEKVSGIPYYDYIRRHITGPLGMNNTDFYRKTDLVPHLARGYTGDSNLVPPGDPRSMPRRDDRSDRLPPPDSQQNRPLREDRPARPPRIKGANTEREDNFSTLPLRGSPAGGAYSTVHDMLRFASALKDHSLLSPEYTDIIMSGKVATPMGEYGYGFEVLTENGYRTMGHSGGAPGINALFRIFMDEDITIVILSNYDMGTFRPYQEIISRYMP